MLFIPIILIHFLEDDLDHKNQGKHGQSYSKQGHNYIKQGQNYGKQGQNSSDPLKGDDYFLSLAALAPLASVAIKALAPLAIQALPSIIKGLTEGG